MDSLQLKICDVQGRLFELSRKACYDSGPFISSFMRSRLAKSLDSVYNRMQWSGEEYLLEELESEVPTLPVTGALYEKKFFLDRVFIPLLALLDRGKQLGNLPPGKRKDHEAKLYDVPYPRARNCSTGFERNTPSKSK